MERTQITIITVQRTMRYEAKSPVSVDQVKLRVEAEFSIPANRQLLFNKGLLLEETVPVAKELSFHVVDRGARDESLRTHAGSAPQSSPSDTETRAAALVKESVYNLRSSPNLVGLQLAVNSVQSCLKCVAYLVSVHALGSLLLGRLSALVTEFQALRGKQASERERLTCWRHWLEVADWLEVLGNYLASETGSAPPAYEPWTEHMEALMIIVRGSERSDTNTSIPGEGPSGPGGGGPSGGGPGGPGGGGPSEGEGEEDNPDAFARCCLALDIEEVMELGDKEDSYVSVLLCFPDGASSGALLTQIRNGEEARTFVTKGTTTYHKPLKAIVGAEFTGMLGVTHPASMLVARNSLFGTKIQDAMNESEHIWKDHQQVPLWCDDFEVMAFLHQAWFQVAADLSVLPESGRWQLVSIPSTGIQYGKLCVSDIFQANEDRATYNPANDDAQSIWHEGVTVLEEPATNTGNLGFFTHNNQDPELAALDTSMPLMRTGLYVDEMFVMEDGTPNEVVQANKLAFCQAELKRCMMSVETMRNMDSYNLPVWDEDDISHRCARSLLKFFLLEDDGEKLMDLAMYVRQGMDIALQALQDGRNQVLEMWEERCDRRLQRSGGWPENVYKMDGEDIETMLEVLPAVEDDEQQREVLPAVEDDEQQREVLPAVEDDEQQREVLPAVEDDEQQREVLPAVEDDEQQREVLPAVKCSEQSQQQEIPAVEEEFEQEVPLLGHNNHQRRGLCWRASHCLRFVFAAWCFQCFGEVPVVEAGWGWKGVEWQHSILPGGACTRSREFVKWK